MKSALLSTLILVAVGVQPVIASQCQFGACNIGDNKGLLITAKTNPETLSEALSGEALHEQQMSKNIERYLGKNLKVNTDSTRKGPGSSSIRSADELAPIRQLKVIRPELVNNGDHSLAIAYYERLA